MPEGALQKAVKTQGRKLPDKIDGQEVLVRDLVNADLDAIDELTDEYEEVERQRSDLRKQIDESDDPKERRELRAEARKLAKQSRDMNTQMLGRYVESKDGQPFEEEALATTPIRVQTLLIQAAAAILFPEDRPTQAGNTATG